MKRVQTGFTLMEVMVTVVIVGILAGLAYPAYVDHMRAARRADGHAALMHLSALMESYFTENNSYAGATTANVGLTGTASPQGFYTLSITTATATAFTVTAAPAGAQVWDTCGNLTLTNTNVRGPNANCWQ